MKLPLTLKTAIADQARRAFAAAGNSFAKVIRTAQRIVPKEISESEPEKRFRTEPRPLGLRDGFSYDDIGALLARAEGADHR